MVNCVNSNETKDYVNHYTEADMTTGEHVTVRTHEQRGGKVDLMI